MIAPERWYEHQKNFQRYGFDMKPQPERRTRTERQRTKKKIAIPGGSGKKLMLSTVVAIGAMMIVLIIMSAYAAGLRYDINSTIKENHVLMGEIENLQVKLYSANNINYVEGKATGDLGMKYPSAKDSIYISSDELPPPGFADMIKADAYN